jgi:transglutaminase-like putative cysteine protease
MIADCGLHHRENAMPRSRVLVGIVVVLYGTTVAHTDDAPPKSRSFRFSYKTLVKDVPADAEEVALWIPCPADDEHQTISNIRVKTDHEYMVTRENEYGNQALYLLMKKPGGRDIEVELQFDAVRREHINRAAANRADGKKKPVAKIPRRWLEADRLVPIDGDVLAMARQAVGSKRDPLAQARAIYDHTVATLKYDKSGTGWGRGDIHYACDARHGNCTDFHAVFIGFCRAVGIPARFQIGFSIPEGKHEGEIAGYHCWAEFYVEGRGWIPVDASEAQKNPDRRDYYFGAHDENRVQLSMGRDIRLSPPQQGERLNFFIYPYAEVDGKPHAKVEKKFSFSDLDTSTEKKDR